LRMKKQDFNHGTARSRSHRFGAAIVSALRRLSFGRVVQTACTTALNILLNQMVHGKSSV
jgi:hypothetical protein